MSETETVTAIVDHFGSELKVEHIRTGAWFTRFVTHSLKRRAAKANGRAETGDAVARAERAVRHACVKSAMTGAAAGAASTTGTLLTAELPAIVGLFALPAAAGAIVAEMLYRASIHIELTCDLAEIFDVRFDPEQPSDLWRIYALAFKTEHAEDDQDEGKALVERVTHLEGHQVGEAIGGKLLGESVMRNIVPFVGIVSSSYMNWKMTERVGNTVRHYLRYQAAFAHALEEEENHCLEFLDLLLEGFWFTFTADGQLNNEEVATLAGLLRKVPEDVRQKAYLGFTRDEGPWLAKLSHIPKAQRPHFYRALEVAAAVDKSVSSPERKLLKAAAKALHVPYDEADLDTLVLKFTESGRL